MDYDKQGEIRTKFQSGTKLLDIEFFKNKFKELDVSEYQTKINEIVNLFLETAKHNQKTKEINSALDYEIQIPCEIEEVTYRFRIIDNLDSNEKDYGLVLKKLKSILNSINQLLKMLEFKDRKALMYIKNRIQKLIDKYKNLEELEEKRVKVVNSIKEISNKYEEENTKISETQENILTSYKQNIVECKNKILSKIKNDNDICNDFLGDYKDITIHGKSNVIGEYNFLKRTKCIKIDKKKMIEILSYPLSRVSKLEQLKKIDEDGIKEKIKKNLKDNSLSFEENYNKVIKDYIDNEILKQEAVILYNDKEISSGNSQGKNALIYLDVLADEKSKKMYIVDQPGDDISHSKLSNEVIDILRRMSINKQVLFVTHKPELVVNLDVDNVIIIKEDNDEINIINGALEYENEEVNILRDVADILDGGEEIIRKRWKRYDK